MTMTDPLGDMLTRIRNAQMRKKTKVATPSSGLRQRVLEVLQSEGYIRGYSKVDYDSGRSEFEIELKYYPQRPALLQAADLAQSSSDAATQTSPRAVHLPSRAQTLSGSGFVSEDERQW